MTAKVSDLIAEFIERMGMRHVFGIIGAGNAHIFDSLGGRGTCEIVCVHHEQAATMAMQVYYRTSGRMTAAIVTTGGGSTNALTGVVSAWMDSLPGLVISGNENSRFTREDNPLRVWGVQGYDSTGIVEKVTKYAVRVTDPTRVVYELEKAYHIAGSGKPGPVWVDIPMDVQASRIEEEDIAHFEPDRAEIPRLGESIARTIELLLQAERPIFWLGNGIRLAGALAQVEPLVERIGAPVLVSWAGIDLIDSDHPLVFGRAGVYGQRAANFVLQNSDLVIAIGTRLAIPQIGYVMEEFARDADLIVVDVDKAEAAKHGDRVTLPVVADAGTFIDALMQGLEGVEIKSRPEWIERCREYRRRYPWIGSEHDDEEPFINSYRFMERLIGQMKPDQVVVTDMGTALLCAHQILKLKPGQRLMTSTGLGEMGYGLPAALGASFARGRGEVLCLNCDGGMMMNLQELQTIVHHRLPIKLIIFNNDGYLMIKHTQTNLFSGRQVGVDQRSGVSCPDFSAVGAAFGIPSYRIRSWDDFDVVMPTVQEELGPVICEVFMHPRQLFVPKLSLALKADGSIVSPPLEDLSPLLSRDEMRENMIIGLHPKSAEL
jgi:acetolactate synthase-1/2/3 large subunit